MVKEYIGEAETLLDATEKAKEGLISLVGLKSADEDNIQIEVVSDYKKKTLGLFGGSLAKVRAFIELPDPAPKKERKAAPKKAEASKPAKKETKSVKSESAPTEAKKEAPANTEALHTVPENLKDYTEFAENTSVSRAATYIKSVLENMGCENISVKAAETESGIYLLLDGEKLGMVIGRRGETLDALQYLTSLSANEGGGYLKVTLNIGNYREKRETTLKALAAKVASQVKTTGRSRTLEPMNPYERRIIHTAIQEIEGVQSSSIGEGTGRRVVVSSTSSSNRSRGGKGGRGYDRKPSQTVSSPAREPKTDSTSVPLYGRLN